MDTNEITLSPVAPLNLELRNVVYNPRLSRGSTCFSATLCIDGEPAIMVSNGGHGGCNDHRPITGQSDEQMEDLVRKIDAYAMTMPPRVYAGRTLYMGIDLLCLELLKDYLNATRKVHSE